MRPARLARILLRTLTVIVLVASGAYLLIYLYRWEWNRALVSGVFFIAAEVALATASLGRRMSRIEGRVNRLDRPAAAAAGREVTGLPAPGAPAQDRSEETGTSEGPFRWLEPGSLSVFVPVLLGVGAILSGIAYVIERIATSTDPDAAQTAVERRLARLQPSAGSVAVDEPTPRTRRARGSWVGVAATLAVATLLVWTLVISLIGLTQNRPDPIGTSGRTSFAMVIDVRGEPADVLPIAQAMVTVCRPMASPWSTIELRPIDGSTVRMDVTPSLAENAGRRFTGCLSDLQLDRVLVHLQTLPVDPGETRPASVPA